MGEEKAGGAARGKAQHTPEPISINVARCPICHHPAKLDDYSSRGSHVCPVAGCVCPTGKGTTRAQRAAIKLRIAALAFARQPDEPADLHDTAGQRANRQLLKAAVEYTHASEHDDSLLPASISHGHGTFIFCVPGRCGTSSDREEQARIGRFVDAALCAAGAMASTASAPKEPPDPTPDPEAQGG